MLGNKYIPLLLLLLLTTGAYSKATIVKGRVTDARSGKPLGYASIAIRDGNRGTTANTNGEFLLTVDGDELVVKISMLGYVSQEKEISPDAEQVTLNIALTPADLRIQDVVVTAKRRNGATSSTRIEESAITHLQASSLSDVMQLLPGALSRDGGLSSVQQLSFRQVVTDNNTAMGTAIVIDGAQMSNDANMQVNSIHQGQPQYATSANGGVDLRLITTDRLQEVEVVRGIPSAKYGDLASGLVLLKSKSGETPLYVRVKAEPTLKMVSTGKGVALAKNRGVANLDFDYTRSYDDVRTPYKGFNRYTSQLGWSRSFTSEKLIANLDTKLGLSYASDVNRNDPNLQKLEESYTAKEQGVRFNIGGTVVPRERGRWSLEYRASVSYAHQESRERNIVSLNGPQPLALSKVDGEYEGIYLPNEYYSDLLIDGKPLNLAMSVSFSNVVRLGHSIHKVMLGGELKSDANLGRGQVFDETKPPFPNTLGATRARAYSDIPWMKKGAWYLEDAITFKIAQRLMLLQAGLRFSTYMAAGNTKYEGKILAEPRINAKYTLISRHSSLWAKQVAIRAGMGISYKSPTLLQLFPDKSYEDITMLNYYSQDASKRLLWVKTMVTDVTNKDLKPLRANKVEVGLDWDTKLFSSAINFYYERQTDGFDFASVVYPVQYRKYVSSSYAGNDDKRPAIQDFKWAYDTLFVGITYPVNGEMSIRKGIEYTFSFKKIESIKTTISVDGAFFRQESRGRYPIYKYPNVTIAGRPYRYVGVFGEAESTTYSRFNTTLRLITHIPAYRLIVSCQLQNVWFSTIQYGMKSKTPDYYIDLDGVKHAFTSDMVNDSYMSYMVSSYSSLYFKERRVPYMGEVNIRITKEFWQNAQVSMLVNRIAEIKPTYTDYAGNIIRSSSMPFFGVELKLSF